MVGTTGGKPHRSDEVGETKRAPTGVSPRRLSWKTLSGYLGSTLIVVGVPESTPAVESVKPAGNAPTVTA